MGNKKIERGLHELYAKDPERADFLIWGRKPDPLTRRGFLKGTGLLAMSALVGAQIPFADKMPSGLIPAALAADGDKPLVLLGKEALIVLSDKPINAETPPHLLDDEVTPAKYFFVRNNGLPPEPEKIKLDEWTLEIAGESCEKPTIFSYKELKEKFKPYTYQLQMECAGNGRKEFNPPAKGNQWALGAIGCANWTGARLVDVLTACGIKSNAVYIGYYGADLHLTRDPRQIPISRGVPLEKALEEESLLAWAMNDEDIPHLNGYPLRLVCGGWPASVSGKWLKKIVIRNKEHDGEKMGGHSYRVPCQPVAPGTDVPEKDMCIVGSMPVKSLITFPKSGITHALNNKLTIRGHAWAGDLDVKEFFVSLDFGATWIKADLRSPKNRLAWQRWQTTLTFPKKGYYEVWARAVDSKGRSQPMVLPNWNPEGYLNNACHRIAVQVV